VPSLRELDAHFLKCVVTDGRVYHHYEGVTLENADGVIFLCPKCFVENGGEIGTHSVICWFIGKVPDDAVPGPGRWNPSGTGLDNLTFIPPGATSVNLDVPDHNAAVVSSGCKWHGIVQNGQAN
jgi:hypothetical protein